MARRASTRPVPAPPRLRGDAGASKLYTAAVILWLLAVTAFGFIAYGIYCFSRTRYRRFEL